MPRLPSIAAAASPTGPSPRRQVPSPPPHSPRRDRSLQQRAGQQMLARLTAIGPAHPRHPSRHGKQQCSAGKTPRSIQIRVSVRGDRARDDKTRRPPCEKRGSNDESHGRRTVCSPKPAVLRCVKLRSCQICMRNTCGCHAVNHACRTAAASATAAASQPCDATAPITLSPVTWCRLPKPALSASARLSPKPIARQRSVGRWKGDMHRHSMRPPAISHPSP